jgi:hypothetical protein
MLLKRTLRFSSSLNSGIISLNQPGIVLGSQKNLVVLGERESSTGIRRYTITDPKAFLIEDYRLTRSEKYAQKVFAVFPWVLWLSLMSAPLGIVYLFDKK